MAKPRLLGIAYAAKAAPVQADWQRQLRAGSIKEKRQAKAHLKSLATFAARAIIQATWS